MTTSQEENKTGVHDLSRFTDSYRNDEFKNEVEKDFIISAVEQQRSMFAH